MCGFYDLRGSFVCHDYCVSVFALNLLPFHAGDWADDDCRILIILPDKTVECQVFFSKSAVLESS